MNQVEQSLRHLKSEADEILFFARWTWSVNGSLANWFRHHRFVWLYGTAAAAPAAPTPAPSAQNKSASTITVTSIVAAIVLLGAGGFAIRIRRMLKQ
jgi:hypothetical protein